MRDPFKLGTVSIALAALMTLSQAAGQVTIQTLKSFGIPDKSGGTPLAPLVLHFDGWLYGTTTVGGSNGFGSVFRIARDGTGYRVLYSFGGSDGRTPQAALMVGSDGFLYGSTSEGGSNTTGTLFKLNRDGTAFSVLHHVSGPESDWGSPRATLCQGTDGILYGTTVYGGSNNAGTIFRISTNGTDHSIIHHFVGTDGQVPWGRLLQGIDGALYGTTYIGGLSNLGTIFKLNTDGTGYNVLRSFRRAPGYNGYNPRGGLVQGLDGTLYGTTESSGVAKKTFGTVFKMSPDGSGFTVLLSFDSGWPYGINPRGELVLSSDGTLFGTTSQSWETGGAGTVFRITTNGTDFGILHGFNTSGSESTYPAGGLVQDSNGDLYGVASQGGLSGVGTVYSIALAGPAYSVLHSFSTSGGDAHYPLGRLVQDNNGALYGVTSAGGTNGCGSIFKINPDGTGYSILKTYSGLDGKNPRGLVLGPDGFLYGTTYAGGVSNRGTIFKMTRDGNSYSVVHDFDGLGGENPEVGVTFATNGVLYGTTTGGGTGFYGSSDGTIYRLNPDGTAFVKLRDFNHGGFADGFWPNAGLAQGVDGVLYGGTLDASIGDGTVFKINLDGSGFNILHTFWDVGGFWSGPFADLSQGSDQAFYGATIDGVIFKIDSDGSNFEELHTLEYNGLEYHRPNLVFGSDGSIYGTDEVGGPNRAGTIFKIDQNGSNYIVLHNFGITAGDGAAPHGPLFLGKDGLWYGTTAAGGNTGCGTVFRMVPTPQIQSFSYMPGGAIQFSIASVSNFVYRIETSTNLFDWVALTNVTATGIQTKITDFSPPSVPQRFYRAVSMP